MNAGMRRNGKRNNSGESREEIQRDDKMALDGTIEEALPGTLFKVKTSIGSTVLCTLSGKLRMNHIKLLPGDAVTVEVSPYDVSRGRVVWRR